jgi:hypothetical protein
MSVGQVPVTKCWLANVGQSNVGRQYLCQPIAYLSNVWSVSPMPFSPMSVGQVSIGKILVSWSTKCLSANYLSVKCLSAQCLSAQQCLFAKYMLPNVCWPSVCRQNVGRRDVFRPKAMTPTFREIFINCNFVISTLSLFIPYYLHLFENFSSLYPSVI